MTSLSAMSIVVSLFFQSGPVPRTEYIAPVSVTRDLEAATLHEDLLKYGAWLRLSYRF